MKYQFFLKILAINICANFTIIAMDEVNKDNPNIYQKASSTINETNSPLIISHNSTPINQMKRSSSEGNILLSKDHYLEVPNIGLCELSLKNDENKENKNNNSKIFSDNRFLTKTSVYKEPKVEESMNINTPSPTDPIDMELPAPSTPLSDQVAKEIAKANTKIEYLQKVQKTLSIKSEEVKNHRYLCKYINKISSEDLVQKSKLNQSFENLDFTKYDIDLKDAQLVVLMRHGTTTDAEKSNSDIITKDNVYISVGANSNYTSSLNELDIFALPVLHSSAERTLQTALLIMAGKNDISNIAPDDRLNEDNFNKSNSNSGTTNRDEILQSRTERLKTDIVTANSVRGTGIKAAATLQSVASQMPPDQEKVGLCITHYSTLLSFYFSSWIDTELSQSTHLLDSHLTELNKFFELTFGKIKKIEPLFSFITVVDNRKANYILLHENPMAVEGLINCIQKVEKEFFEIKKNYLKSKISNREDI